MPPTKFRVSTGLSVQEKKRKIDFQDCGHLGFSIRTILAILDLQVTLMLPTKFRVSWLLGLGEEAKNRFSRRLPWRPSLIYDRHDFLIYKSPQYFLPSFESTGLSFQKEKRKIDFQDGCHGGHLGFPIGTILAIFDLQVIPMLLSKFGVNWPFGSAKEAKNRFSRWLPWRSSWISDRHNFSYFWSISHPNASYQVLNQLAYGFRSRSEK